MELLLAYLDCLFLNCLPCVWISVFHTLHYELIYVLASVPIACIIALTLAGIRVQSLKEGLITMDIDLRWGGDPSIIIAAEAARVASIPIQVGAQNT